MFLLPSKDLFLDIFSLMTSQNFSVTDVLYINSVYHHWAHHGITVLHSSFSLTSPTWLLVILNCNSIPPLYESTSNGTAKATCFKAPLFKKGGEERKRKKRERNLKSMSIWRNIKGGGLHFAFTKCILYQGRKILAWKIQKIIEFIFIFIENISDFYLLMF